MKNLKFVIASGISLNLNILNNKNHLKIVNINEIKFQYNLKLFIKN